MDTRVPAGLMPAASYGRGENGTIIFIFDPFAAPSPEPTAMGKLVRMEQVIIQKDADHDQKDQYIVLADGSGKKFLVHRYEYARRRTPLK